MGRQSTPHINPNGVPIAETILLPGDPLRAKFIAETYLDDAVQFNSVRNAFGYTGTYQGKEVSVMGSGMGIPSISLYAWELIHDFGVKKLVRVGSCGSLQKDLNLYDVVIGQAACTDSNFLSQYNLPGTYAPIASYRLIEDVRNRAKEAGITTHVGNVLSSDVFYNYQDDVNQRWAAMGVLAVEMESAGLYATAAEAGVEALGIFTVSDNIVTGEATTASEREKAFTTMMELALPLAAI
ncbi:purine-nucleoside phosphorylase [Corynebacterium pseudokroppenstedtii]|uniref:Uridine phosphorylase n=1 Tax=Corynebacterium pseudokroppenstedtii TaxID=2804917 RepID=A0AAU0Q3C4_9CORY|nr:purine-nucleoside phosphorylase [Corynebacterium pseudokroppenstedtii]MBY0791040.1 purine-nucleoside phosphorylase [Corynebacterium pseudokroppenstedtii]MCF6793282.1 purine-nucleoside phosphorylase [Corynebacterium pseudokroppenstedtii]MCF8703091.1 purine-nucleoside phosphorylase [Corynebacterium pseudokroppenstedtii]MCG2636310.1 purine-nucleoside phosphorylase [Corynebacterium pseudokroppenstedtii]